MPDSVKTNLLQMIDSEQPDPFTHEGFIGLLDRSAERASVSRTLTSAGLDTSLLIIARPDVAYYRFANGWAAGVLLGNAQHPACSVASAEQPFEMAVMHGRSLKLCRNSPFDEDVICPLDTEGVRRQLDQIAALPPQPGCRHR